MVYMGVGLDPAYVNRDVDPGDEATTENANPEGRNDFMIQQVRLDPNRKNIPQKTLQGAMYGGENVSSKSPLVIPHRGTVLRINEPEVLPNNRENMATCVTNLVGLDHILRMGDPNNTCLKDHKRRARHAWDRVSIAGASWHTRLMKDVDLLTNETISVIIRGLTTVKNLGGYDFYAGRRAGLVPPDIREVAGHPELSTTEMSGKFLATPILVPIPERAEVFSRIVLRMETRWNGLFMVDIEEDMEEQKNMIMSFRDNMVDWNALDGEVNKQGVPEAFKKIHEAITQEYNRTGLNQDIQVAIWRERASSMLEDFELIDGYFHNGFLIKPYGFVLNHSQHGKEASFWVQPLH